MSTNNVSSYGSSRNYLIPAAGSTHYATISGVFNANPVVQDWGNFSIDNFPFVPQGAFIDNSQGTGPLQILIQPVNYTVTVPAGIVSQVQFPAPPRPVMYITGQGQASIIFVDFPVLPNNGLVDIGNTVNVNLAAIAAGVTVPVSLPTNFGGAPYQTQQTPGAGNYGHGSISGAGTSASFTPGTANLNLRKLALSITENASLAAAGIVTLSVTVNGAAVFSEGIYLPATAGANAGEAYTRNLDFDGIALPAGTGNITVTLSSALATGQLDFNSYFA